jgi:hypothetical protein
MRIDIPGAAMADTGLVAGFGPIRAIKMRGSRTVHAHIAPRP